MLYKNLLIIGGTGRNVGKTELICQLIRKHRNLPIIAVKISSVAPSGIKAHGDHSGLPKKQNFIFEEKNTERTKDTSRMLIAGAKQAYYCQVNQEKIDKAGRFIESLLKKGHIVICESNLIHRRLNKANYIVVHSPERNTKPQASKNIKEANLIVLSNGKNKYKNDELITYSQNRGWAVQEQTSQ